MIVFGSVTPAGIFVGMAVSDDIDGVGIAVLIALAAGTFIYVSLIEIVQPELVAGHHNFWKLIVMGVGWGLMSMLALWV